MAKAQAVRERMRLEGNDPAHGGGAAKKRTATQRELQRLNLEWKANPTHAMSEADYRSEVLPRIAVVPARSIARAIGVSIEYASDFREGQRLPHPRHWPKLANSNLETQPAPLPQLKV